MRLAAGCFGRLNMTDWKVTPAPKIFAISSILVK